MPTHKLHATRADLPRATAADIERERIIAMADALEYELPNYEQMKGVEALRKKLQAEPPRAVVACLAELQIMFPSRWVEVISGLNAVGGEYYFVRVYGLTRRSSCSSLDEGEG